MAKENPPQRAPQEITSHQRLIEIHIDRTANAIKNLIFDYQREKLPILPKYDGYYEGYDEQYREVGKNPDDFRIGMRVTGSLGTTENPLIVLEPDDLYLVPNVMDER